MARCHSRPVPRRPRRPPRQRPAHPNQIASSFRPAAGTYAVTTVAFNELTLDSHATLYSATGSTVFELNRVTPATLTFAALDGTTTAQQVEILENDGNATLTLSALSTASPFSLGAATNCTATATLTTASPTTGYASTVLVTPSAIVLDTTGGVWVTNESSNSVTHIFGVAAPVVTPLSTAVTNSVLGTKP